MKFVFALILVMGLGLGNLFAQTSPRWGNGKTSFSGVSVGPRITYTFAAGLDTLKFAPNAFIVPVYLGSLSDSLVVDLSSLTGSRLLDNISFSLANSAEGAPTRKIKFMNADFVRPTTNGSIQFIAGTNHFYCTVASGNTLFVNFTFNGQRYQFSNGCIATNQ